MLFLLVGTLGALEGFKEITAKNQASTTNATGDFHWIINGIDEFYPEVITVTLKEGTSSITYTGTFTVPLQPHESDPVAHYWLYGVDFFQDDLDAVTTVINEEWDGQFNLSESPGDRPPTAVTISSFEVKAAPRSFSWKALLERLLQS